MVKCVNCGRFTRKTRECSGYKDSNDNPVVLKPKEIHREMTCPRYIPRSRKTVKEVKNGNVEDGVCRCETV